MGNKTPSCSKYYKKPKNTQYLSKIREQKPLNFYDNKATINEIDSKSSKETKNSIVSYDEIEKSLDFVTDFFQISEIANVK